MNQNNKPTADGKINADSITIESPGLSKFANFWYHNKWVVLISAFFIVVITVCVVQMVGRDSQDISVLYAGNKYISADEMTGIKESIEKILPSDFDGDGKKLVAFTAYEIYSEDEIKELEAQTDDSGSKITINTLYNKDQYSNFTSNVGMQFSLCFIDEYLYGEMCSAGRVAPLSDFFGTQMPNGALSDGFGIRLGDTDFYKYFSGIQVLPDDTVVCMMKQTVLGNSNNDALYNFTGEVFVSIAQFDDGE